MKIVVMDWDVLEEVKYLLSRVLVRKRERSTSKKEHRRQVAKVLLRLDSTPKVDK